MHFRLLAEYLEFATPRAVAEAVEMLAGPPLLRMIHTRHGAYVGCAIMAYGTPKDRKKAIKAMKGGRIAFIYKHGTCCLVCTELGCGSTNLTFAFIYP